MALLKRVLLNQKAIPVPVPLSNVALLKDWVEKHFIRGDAVLTRVHIDGQEAEALWHDARRASVYALNEQSTVSLSIESPYELSLQTISALHDFLDLVQRQLKSAAVSLWQVNAIEDCETWTEVFNDLKTIKQLMDHIQHLTQGVLLVDRDEFIATCQYFGLLFGEVEKAHQKRDHRAVARLLLNRLEDFLKDFISDVETFHLRILTHKDFFNPA